MGRLARLIPEGRQARREALAFYIFIAPWIIGFLAFTIGPVIASFGLSFTQFRYSQVGEPPKFLGLGNYQMLANDKVFWKSLKVTAYYSLLSVPLGIIASLSLAALLNQKVPALSIFRTIYYLPSIITGVAVAILWRWILNPEFGVLNFLIALLVGKNGLIPLGIRGPKWFFSEQWVVPAYVLMSLWGLGGPMVIYLAGLQGVPTALYDAATIDGANAWQRFRNVTLPMISPVIQFTFITSIIGSFQIFTQAYVISGGRGEPNYASMFYVLYIFLQAFRIYRMGYAAAMAWILFLIILVLTIVALRVSSRAVHYEAPGGGRL
jgi:multiple sugar transport system permease protein